MPTSTVSIGGVTVNGPVSPVGVRLLPLHVWGQTAGGQTFVYKLSATKRWEWTLELHDLTTSQRSALETYFLDTAGGPANTWTYIHTNGTTYTGCRFRQTELNWRRNATGNWDLSLLIEVPLAPT